MICSPLFAQPLAWHLTEQLHVDADTALAEHPLIIDTIEAVAELARQRGHTPDAVNLDIASELIDENGRKFGLGSSGAVVVALVKALGQAWQLELSRLDVYKVALIATVKTSPRASGADIATSTVTGWVRYASPNRDWVASYRTEYGVAATVQQPWDGLELERLPAPEGIAVSVGWTGSPADTDALVQASSATPITREAFLTASRGAVETITQGCLKQSTALVLEGFAASRDALLTFDAAGGNTIDTPELALLRRIAEEHGAYAKPSGAGGGDCGIVLSDRHAKLHRIATDWDASGILPLEIDVYTQEDAS